VTEPPDARSLVVGEQQLLVLEHLEHLRLRIGDQRELRDVERRAREHRCLADQIARRGRQVIDPRRALETGRSFKPDLVLVDLIMSQEDGIEVAAQLEADWALHGVPIVFVTALITPEEARDGRRVNGHRIVAKPARRSDLLRIVEESLPCCAAA